MYLLFVILFSGLLPTLTPMQVVYRCGFSSKYFDSSTLSWETINGLSVNDCDYSGPNILRLCQIAYPDVPMIKFKSGSRPIRVLLCKQESESDCRYYYISPYQCVTSSTEAMNNHQKREISELPYDYENSIMNPHLDYRTNDNLPPHSFRRPSPNEMTTNKTFSIGDLNFAAKLVTPKLDPDIKRSFLPSLLVILLFATFFMFVCSKWIYGIYRVRSTRSQSKPEETRNNNHHHHHHNDDEETDHSDPNVRNIARMDDSKDETWLDHSFIPNPHYRQIDTVNA